MLPKFLRCSQAPKANLLFLLVLAKKSQCLSCLRMLAKTIHHPFIFFHLFFFFITPITDGITKTYQFILSSRTKNTLKNVHS